MESVERKNRKKIQSIGNSEKRGKPEQRKIGERRKDLEAVRAKASSSSSKATAREKSQVIFPPFFFVGLELSIRLAVWLCD